MLPGALRRSKRLLRLHEDLDRHEFVARLGCCIFGKRHRISSLESYRVKVGKRAVQVDVIVRNDEMRAIYDTAVADALETDSHLTIVSPEWLVVMKQFSARAKDKIDLIWLLQEEGIVERDKLGADLSAAIGKDAAFYVLADLQSEYDYADFLKMRERSKYSK